MMRRLQRGRPDLMIGAALAVGFAARLIAVVAVDGTGLSSALRGGDETTFLNQAQPLAMLPFSSAEWITEITTKLHVALFAGQIRLLDATPTAMRMVQIAIAMAGLMLLAAAVHDLAGARAARLAAWVLMLEPAGVFFNSALHKEPLMLLASGTIVYGGVRLWRNLDLRGIAILAVGGTIGVCTRPYAGWFLVSACVLLVLHAAFRRLDRPLRAMPAIYAVALIGFLVFPTLVDVSSNESLETLQSSQTANTDPAAQARSTGSNANNLALEHVDYSSREQVALNLPKRAIDVLTKPYPWQLANPSQALGAVGSVAALTGLIMLLGYGWRARGRIFAVTGPFLYPLMFLLMAYSLSAGNAGTGFRYRTHIVTLSLAMLLTLRSVVLERRSRATVAARPLAGTEAPARALATPLT
ncbi:MAG: glycosyltransferase family 39 protein [Solirubrobacteraceae bacterium]